MPAPSSPPGSTPAAKPGNAGASRHTLYGKYILKCGLQPPSQEFPAEQIDELSLAVALLGRLVSDLEELLGKEQLHG